VVSEKYIVSIASYFLFGMQLHQQCEDRHVLRYVYYYLARILSDSGSHGVAPGGGISTPNWDALADLNASGGVTRADVLPKIIEQLIKEASNDDVEGDVFIYLIIHQIGWVILMVHISTSG
jgi:hypothetical protein